jgi:4-carboxymuconolactone decarboxylase
VMGAEDISFFAQQVPGFYFLLGARPRGVPIAEAAFNHSPLFDIDEAALETDGRRGPRLSPPIKIFTKEGPMSQEDYDKGLEIRRSVLGAAHVDKAIAGADEFSQPMQDFVTEYCWGAVWSRPGLEKKTRSMLNVAMLTALNREHELRLHLRGALNNGVSRAEISEILLQCAVYCGAPAAISSFRIAREVFAEVDGAE